MSTITDDQMEELHDLVTMINRRQYEQERDIRNLYNLVHAIQGVGFRSPEYDKPYSERRLDNNV
jgi:hypothetical protein